VVVGAVAPIFHTTLGLFPKTVEVNVTDPGKNGFSEIRPMSKLKLLFVVPAATLAMIFMSSSLAAQCSSCASAGGSFGYPGGCQDCAGGAAGVGGNGPFQQLQSGINSFKADYRINHARNSAWPLPFSCWDRENYNAILNQQFATGNQIAHTLTAQYFDPESNELNRAGELRVSWIMQNAPQRDKQIFVFEDQQGPTIDQRIASISNFTGRYYAHMGNATVAKSRLLPNQIPATYQQGYNQSYAEGQPDPVIPVDAGSTINATVSN